MGLSNKLSCEAGSFLCHCNPNRFLQPEVLRLYFPMLEPWVVQFVSLPSCSSRFICTQMWDVLLCQLPPHLLGPSTAALPCIISSPPTGLNECFFFNSLVVGLPYSLIFWQFWLFFVLKCVVVLLGVQGGKVYLPTPQCWPEVWELKFLIMLRLAQDNPAEICTLTFLTLKFTNFFFGDDVKHVKYIC